MKKYIKDGIIKYKYQIVIIKDVGIDGKKFKKSYIARSEEEILNAGWLPYEDLEELKKEKLQKLIEYDKSLNVNSFYLNLEQTWIDRDTRVSLMNSTTILKNSGQETTTLWLNGQSFTIPCDGLIQMLGTLEIYALQCYNVTEQHKSNINSLESIVDVNNYDFKTGYPEKLTFSI